jgi:hypothetical protein
VSAVSIAVVGIAAFVVAAGIIWTKLLRPAARLIVLGESLLPLLQNMVEHLGHTSEPFSVLNEIVAEFRTDSGSSLRDVVNRLEQSVGRLDERLDALTNVAEAGAQTGLRIESAADDVAENLARKELP